MFVKYSREVRETKKFDCNFLLLLHLKFLHLDDGILRRKSNNLISEKRFIIPHYAVIFFLRVFMAGIFAIAQRIFRRH